MNPHLQKLIPLLFLLFTSTYSQAQQHVNLSTGSGAGIIDPIWQVKIPGGTAFQTSYRTGGLFYGGIYGNWSGANNCFNWTSPYVDTSTMSVYYGQVYGGLDGYYVYKMEFSLTAACPRSAVIVLDALGADNNASTIRINNNPPHGLPQPNNFVTIATNKTINIPVSELLPGQLNTIYVTVSNGGNYTGLLICGRLDIYYYSQTLTPTIQGPSEICFGQPLTFTGTLGKGQSATNSYWEIVEANSSGVPIPGGAVWNTSVAGDPGTLTFPGMACGKYYKVNLTVENPCVQHAATSTLVYINCPPPARAGQDKTICNGTCITLGGAATTPSTSYQWAMEVKVGWGGWVYYVPVANTPQLKVCPTHTTTYVLTATSNITGCSESKSVTISVDDNPPDFSLSTNFNPNNNYYGLLATPLNTNVSNIAGFGYAWIVEEVASPSNVTLVPGSEVNNSGCWWNALLTTDFNGYDGPYFTNTALNPMHLGCGTSANGLLPGKFTEGHTYRITRGTWSNACKWQQSSIIVDMDRVP